MNPSFKQMLLGCLGLFSILENRSSREQKLTWLLVLEAQTADASISPVGGEGPLEA